MEESKYKLVVILNESVAGSVIKDAGTFLLFGGLMYFNHAVLSGNGWIDFTFIVLVFLWLSTLKSKQVFHGSTSEAIKWLKEKK